MRRCRYGPAGIDQTVRDIRISQPVGTGPTDPVIDTDTHHSLGSQIVEDLVPVPCEVTVLGDRDDRFGQPTPPRTRLDDCRPSIRVVSVAHQIRHPDGRHGVRETLRTEVPARRHGHHHSGASAGVWNRSTGRS